MINYLEIPPLIYNTQNSEGVPLRKCYRGVLVCSFKRSLSKIWSYIAILSHMIITWLRGDQFVIQVISSVLVHYLDSQTPPVQVELVGQEDRVRPDTYRGGRERDNHLTMILDAMCMHAICRKMANCTHGLQRRECRICATEQLQRTPHKFFDLRCLLST